MQSSAIKKRVLIVEDEPSIQKMCQRVLSGEKLDVDIATDGKQAQEMINSKQYDLLLIDFKMPAVDGRQLYEWLKTSHPQLVDGVIFTTGDIMGRDTRDFLEQAGRPFLPKPLTPAELRATIKKASEEGK